jgi:hypothetical protein
VALTYTEIPPAAKWQQDSSVSLAVRSRDVVLAQIDVLIETYGKFRTEPKGLVVACDLFFTLDYWLKSYPTNSLMEKGRARAVQALYECVAYMLCRAFGCTINTLPRELELMFGRELSDVGVKVDVLEIMGKKAFYATRADLPLFRLRFKHGMVYQFKWWEKGSSGLVLANSARAYSPGAGVGDIGNNYGYFVASMGREIYMMRHGPIKDSNYRIFHSTYLAGGTTMAAGSMLIEHGIVKRIRPDSGHYKPTNSNMLALLQTLQMVGVQIAGIIMENFHGQEVGLAADFFRQNADWERLLHQRDQTLQDNKTAFAHRPKIRAPASGAPEPSEPTDYNNWV